VIRSANTAAEPCTNANTETKYTFILLILYFHSSSEVSIIHCKFIRVTVSICRSQWPRYLRRRSAIVGSNPTGAWMFVVFVVCCHVDVSATG
jgi:hypothetical protein